jgi:putative ABC transport system substrate-binding protein
MRRRDFIRLLGATAATWPFTARAQTGRTRRIAVLVGTTENDPEAPLSSEAFRQTLNQLGWKEGVSVRIDTRWAAGDPDRMHAYAKELIDAAPDVAVADSTPAALALHRESQTTPIIFIQAGHASCQQAITSTLSPLTASSAISAKEEF